MHSFSPIFVPFTVYGSVSECVISVAAAAAFVYICGIAGSVWVLQQHLQQMVAVSPVSGGPANISGMHSSMQATLHCNIVQCNITAPETSAIRIEAQIIDK
jgi:hypothetical protein